MQATYFSSDLFNVYPTRDALVCEVRLDLPWIAAFPAEAALNAPRTRVDGRHRIRPSIADETVFDRLTLNTAEKISVFSADVNLLEWV